MTKGYHCNNNGRPSIDPVLPSRTQTICHSYGTRSNRTTCKEIHCNTAHRWFRGSSLEDKAPDHSPSSRTRDRPGAAPFQEILPRPVKQWYKVGTVKGEAIISDASLVEADASMNSPTTRKEKDDSQKRESKTHERCYHDSRKGKKERRTANQTHTSKTDSDCTPVSRTSGYKKLCYKSHHSIDSGSRTTVDCYASTGPQHECTAPPNRASYILHNPSPRIK